MRFELDDYTRGLTDEELIADLRRVAALIGKDSVTVRVYNQHGRCGAKTLMRRFGSWFAALDKAGLNRTCVMGLTDEQYFENLERVWIHLGRQPTYGEMRAPLSEYSSSGYEKRFGTWRRALEAFVTYVNAGSDEGMSEETEQADILESSNSTKREVSLKDRFLVLRRDSFRCVSCGRSPATHLDVELVVDHVRPWSKGGETILGNLQTLCAECNLGKSDRDMVAEPLTTKGTQKDR